MHFFRDGCVTDFCSCKIGIPYILYISSVLDKIAWSDFEQALPGPKGGGHACMDAGGRATQEQLPRKPGVILMYDLYTAVLDSGSRLRSTSCDPHGCGKCQSDVGTSLAFHAVVRAVLPCHHEKITIFRGAHSVVIDSSTLAGEPDVRRLDGIGRVVSGTRTAASRDGGEWRGHGPLLQGGDHVDEHALAIEIQIG